MNANKPQIRNYLLLLTGIICISWSAILVKLADVTGIASGFYRLFFGTLAIIPVWLYYKKPITDLKGVRIAIICGILFGADIALWNSSIMLSKASISTLLANLAPIWVGLGALFFMKEKPGKIFWVGTFIALAGVVMIVGGRQVFGNELTLGNGLAILASMFYGAYLLTVRKGRNTLDTFSFTTISMITSTIVLGIISLFSGVPMWGFSTPSWIYLIALGIVPQVIGWLTINQALGHISPTVASVSLLSQSVFTAIFSVPVLSEYLSWPEMLGAIVVLAGIFLVNSPKFQWKRKRARIDMGLFD
jgi:drug/metabolite transporter (DMT)-like permease